MRWVISPAEEFTAENIFEEVDDFDHEHGARF
jgi:hypothetical protein